MATFNKQYYEQNNISAANVDTFLTSVGITHTKEGEVNTITLGNNISIIITHAGSGLSSCLKITVNNDGTTSEEFVINRYATLIAAKTANMVYFQVYSGYIAISSNYGSFAALYETIGETDYFGFATVKNGNSFIPLNNITITDLTNSANYNHGTMLDYSVQSGYVDFIMFDSLFASGIKTAINDLNFKACTSVSSNGIITMQGKNHFCMSAHALLEIDD